MQVVYVVRGFPKEEDKAMNQVIISLERFMAGEYSRQLSSKVFHGCCYIARQGYSAGGKACFGLDRILLDEARKPIQVLQPGQHKLISNQRATFAPGKDEKSECVKLIFDLCTKKGLDTSQIANSLNNSKSVALQQSVDESA